MVRDNWGNDDGFPSNSDYQTLLQMQMQRDIEAMRNSNFPSQYAPYVPQPKRGSWFWGSKSSGIRGRGLLFWAALTVFVLYFIIPSVGGPVWYLILTALGFHPFQH
jgi:hypothetical protein